MGVHLKTLTFNPFDTSPSNQNYLNTCKIIWENTTNNNVYPVFTLKHLALLSNTDYALLLNITHRKIDMYKNLTIKSDNKKRNLLIPSKELSTIQYWIKKNILDNVSSSEYSMAYDKNCSIVKNANFHINSPWLIKLDLKNFFDSIYEKDVYNIFRQLGYTQLLSLEFARICTYQNYNKDKLINTLKYQGNTNYPYIESKGYLPQGATTSPKLANLFARKLDEDISLYLKIHFNKSNFTRYSDDIIISGNFENLENCKQILKKIKEIIKNNNLKVNEKKTKIFSPTAIKKVTGINIIGGVLKPSKKIINYIQTSLYYIEKYSIAKHLEAIGYQYDVDIYKEHLLGKIFFVKFVNNELGEKFLNKYNAIFN